MPPPPQGITMPDQNAGRQSPSPSRQSGGQLNDPQAKPNDQNAAPSPEHSQKVSKNALDNLESNPKHILAEASEEKTSKTK
ncbi:hypothetical protein EJ06DRAFT_583597 [Trichodelitschia bisporula]|uniref:Uncharacterized protein n=1 Tax=Trichodelitschia bisporula TaxID=703511 RepID=A0A6G1HR41_9PEZI|nr:hypothetical protein EJ06DRAFT_583597 [Trichodelitschia bisporula]